MGYYFITNREISDAGKIREDGREHAGDNLRFGKYDLDGKEFTLFPEPNTSTDLAYDTLNSTDLENVKGSSRFFLEVYNELTSEEITKTPDGLDKTDVLFFIHGFNSNLDTVRDYFDSLNKKYVENEECTIKHIIVFTWPGMEKSVPLHYHDDKKDAIRSGECLARGFQKLEDFFKLFLVQAKNPACNRKIHLMVHSMGHRVLKHLLLSLNEVPEVFDQILLIAADIEYDIFEPNNAFYKTIDLGQVVHVYFHEKDRVLDISKYTKNFNNRLGRYGRKHISPGLKDVFDANVTNSEDDKEYSSREDKLNHWYYYSSSDVVNDIISVFKGNKSAFAISS